MTALLQQMLAVASEAAPVLLQAVPLPLLPTGLAAAACLALPLLSLLSLLNAA
jgi:hypothetical protein